MKEECENCRFWRPELDPPGIKGYCHRRAPFVPLTSNCWCGEYQPAKAEDHHPLVSPFCPFCAVRLPDAALQNSYDYQCRCGAKLEWSPPADLGAPK